MLALFALALVLQLAVLRNSTLRGGTCTGSVGSDAWAGSSNATRRKIGSSVGAVTSRTTSRAKVAFELHDEGGRAEGSEALPPGNGSPLPLAAPPPRPPAPAPPVLHAVVVDLLDGVDAVEVVRGPLLGCWDPLPFHLRDCVTPLPLTPPRH